MTSRGSGATGRLRRAWLLAGLAAVLAAAALAPRADAAITVYTPERAVLAKYPAVSCAVTKVKGERRFTAVARAGANRLRVFIFPGDFTGFRRYPVMYGSSSDADVGWGRGSRLWSNIFKPRTGGVGGPQLTVAGSVQFPRGRRVLRVGIPIMYDADFGDDWVSVVGQAPCRY